MNRPFIFFGKGGVGIGGCPHGLALGFSISRIVFANVSCAASIVRSCTVGSMLVLAVGLSLDLDAATMFDYSLDMRAY